MTWNAPYVTHYSLRRVFWISTTQKNDTCRKRKAILPLQVVTVNHIHVPGVDKRQCHSLRGRRCLLPGLERDRIHSERGECTSFDQTVGANDPAKYYGPETASRDPERTRKYFSTYESATWWGHRFLGNQRGKGRNVSQIYFISELSQSFLADFTPKGASNSWIFHDRISIYQRFHNWKIISGP